MRIVKGPVAVMGAVGQHSAYNAHNILPIIREGQAEY